MVTRVAKTASTVHVFGITTQAKRNTSRADDRRSWLIRDYLFREVGDGGRSVQLFSTLQKRFDHFDDDFVEKHLR